MNYLKETFDLNDQSLVSVYDDLPLWSSYFGGKLLDYVDYKTGITVLDIGCGTGFPLVELGQRLGSDSRIYGIDPWKQACKRAELKIRTLKLNNVAVINGSAEHLEFVDNYFDLAVSNNGINNVKDSQKVLSECYRTLKKGGQFVMTVNLPGTMMDFYTIFCEVLARRNLDEQIKAVGTHIRSKRKTLEENIDIVKKNGFTIKEVVEDSFYMRFADGSAFLNHYFIKLAFMDSWKNILPEDDIYDIFSEIESELNKKASQEGHLKLRIPYLLINAYK